MCQAEQRLLRQPKMRIKLKMMKMKIKRSHLKRRTMIKGEMLMTPKNIDYLKKQVVIAKDLTSDVVKKLEKGATVSL